TMSCPTTQDCRSLFRKDHCGIYAGGDFNMGTYRFGGAFAAFTAEVVFGVDSWIAATLRSDVEPLNWVGGELKDLILPKTIIDLIRVRSLNAQYIIYLETPGAPTVKVPYAWGTLKIVTTLKGA